MAESKTADDWELIKSKTTKYLQAKFGWKVADAFLEIITEQYDELEEIQNDLEKEDEDSWENSAIIEEIGDTAELTIDKKKSLFNRLRVCVGLETDDLEKTFELLDELDFDVGKEDLLKANKYWSTQCPTLGGSKDHTMIKLIAIGIKNDIPLLSLLNDLYQIWRLNNESHRSENEWVNSSRYLRNMKQKQLIIGGLRSYSSRVLPSLSLKPVKCVDDSLSEYIQIILNMAAMIQNMVQSSDQKQSFPLQIDLWIIPQKAHYECNYDLPLFDDDSDDDDDDDDDDDEDDDDIGDEKEDKDEVDLGDITALLDKDKIKYTHDLIEVSNEANCIRKMMSNLNKTIGNSIRTRNIMIIDRREKKEDKYDLYCYKAPDPIGDISSDYLHEQMMHHTHAYFIPHPDDEGLREKEKKINLNRRVKPIGGGFTSTQREFFVSFHMHSVDNISMYIWLNGCGVRFLPEHLIDILPNYFRNNDLKENGIDQDYVNKKFKLKCTDRLFDSWNKLINDK